MTGLSRLDQMLDVEPISSIAEFRSEEARALAQKFGISLEEIPALRKLWHDYGLALERRVAPQGVMGAAAKILAAEAMFLYEQSVRGKDFKLILPGETVASAQLYDHVTGVNPNASKANKTFGELYAQKAEQFLG